MKLKRSYWAKAIAVLICTACLSLNISCASNKIAVPIPGQSEAVQKNIFIEYMNIADIYFDLAKYDKAETYYKAAMGNNDIYWTAIYKLARCYAYESKWADAQTVYETLLKRDPENNAIKSSIAYIYAMTGNTDKACAMYETLIQENPDQSEYLENYICVLLGIEKKEEAKQSYLELKEKFPQCKRLEEFDPIFKDPEPEPEDEPISGEEGQADKETQPA